MNALSGVQSFTSKECKRQALGDAFTGSVDSPHAGAGPLFVGVRIFQGQEDYNEFPKWEQVCYSGLTMRLVGKGRLNEFKRKHQDVRKWIDAWIAEVERATWENTQDIRRQYNSATVISKDTVVFDVKGNHYRLEVFVSFERGIVSVTRWGTHAEYDKWTY